MIVPFAVVARCVAVVGVLRPVGATLVACYQVGGEIDVRELAAGVEVQTWALERRERVARTVIVLDT